MACFDDIVTVGGACTTPVPTSGLTLNDIGITLKFLNDIVTEDYKNGEALANQKIGLAVKVISNQINLHFADKFRTTSLLEGARAGFPQDNLKNIAGTAGKLKGIELEICNRTSFVDLYISELSLQTTFTGNIDVLVYDLIQGTLLDTIVVPTIANEISSVFVNKTYKSNRKKLHLIFVYDTSAITSISTTIAGSGCSTCGGLGIGRLNTFLSGRGVKIDAIDLKIDSNLEGSSETGGMSIVYSINCNHEDWLCTKRNVLGLPILYKAAAEILEFALDDSDRNNSKTIIDRDIMQEKFDKMEFKYRESLDNILKTILLPDDKMCYSCNPKSIHKIILP